MSTPGENLFEPLIDFLKALFEAQPADPVQLDDGALEVGHRSLQVLLLLGEKLVAAIEFFEFADSGQIHFTHPLQPVPQLLDFRQQLLPGNSPGKPITRRLFEIHVVFFPDTVKQVLQVEPFFR